VLASCLLLVVSLAAAAGAPRARSDPHPELRAENAARARRGLLPRKLAKARAPNRSRRIVLLPPAPTFLGEPVITPAAALERAEEATESPPLWAVLDGAEVQMVMVRRRVAPAP